MNVTDVAIGDVLLPAVRDRGSRATHVKHLLTGHWFSGVMVEYLKARERKSSGERTVARDPMADAQRIMRRASTRAALVGTGAAAITTSAGTFTLNSNGWTGILALPAASAAMAGDMLLRAIVNLDMCCDIAELFDVHFDASDPADLARLHAVAHHVVDVPDDAGDRGHDALDALTKLDPEQVGRAVGVSSSTETVLRNVIPFVGLVTSTVTSYRLTRRLGWASLQYARARAAFREALAPFADKAPPDVFVVLIEGIWFAFTSDGQLDESDAAILAHLLHARPDDIRHRLLDRLRDDEAGWIARLGAVPGELREEFYRVICVATAVHGELTPGDRRFVVSAAEALGVDPRIPELERLAQGFRDTGHAGARA